MTTDGREKLCLFCKHFYFTMGEQGWSEMTPGSDASFDCMKGVWSMSNYGDRAEFIAGLDNAKTCKRYEV